MNEELKNNTYKILELFILYPDKDFYIREIARKLKISHVTVIKKIAELKKIGLIKKKESNLYPLYYADSENDLFKFYKKNHILFKIKKSGLIEFIKKEVLPSSIILFGSSSKGTDKINSDIDLFVESKEKKMNLSLFEKRVKRKINIIFEDKINNLSKELKNNIINGIVLYGFIRI